MAGAAPWEVWKTNKWGQTLSLRPPNALKCLTLNFPNSASPFKILCLGSHSDDIEIGCGGTLLRLLSCHQNLDIVWVVFSSSKEREQEARNSAELFLGLAKQKEIIVKDFRDGFFPFEGAKIKDFFEGLKAVSPI